MSPAVLNLDDAARISLGRDLTNNELATILEEWAGNREYHAHTDGGAKLLSGALLLRQAARRLRYGEVSPAI